MVEKLHKKKKTIPNIGDGAERMKNSKDWLKVFSKLECSFLFLIKIQWESKSILNK